MTERELWSIDEIATALGLVRGGVYTHLRRRKIQPVGVGRSERTGEPINLYDADEVRESAPPQRRRGAKSTTQALREVAELAAALGHEPSIRAVKERCGVGQVRAQQLLTERRGATTGGTP